MVVPTASQNFWGFLNPRKLPKYTPGFIVSILMPADMLGPDLQDKKFKASLSS